MYNFDQNIPNILVTPLPDNDLFTRIMVHRVNLPDAATLESTSEIKELVGSKSGISVIDSRTSSVLLPPGTSAEVDFWVFGDNQILVTHNNPILAKASSYPTLEQFIGAWNIKKECEKRIGAAHGLIHANLKTHGNEERFIERCIELGILTSELVLLDQETPAADRLMREKKFGEIAPLALRVSRLESFESILLAVKQKEIFAAPYALFYDPVGQEIPNGVFPFTPSDVAELYLLSPNIEFILCCPSRWGKTEQIEPLARRLNEVGLKKPIVMTDINLIPIWENHLRSWTNYRSAA